MLSLFYLNLLAGEVHLRAAEFHLAPPQSSSKAYLVPLFWVRFDVSISQVCPYIYVGPWLFQYLAEQYHSFVNTS